MPEFSLISPSVRPICKTRNQFKGRKCGEEEAPKVRSSSPMLHNAYGEGTGVHGTLHDGIVG
jgi:hypothetical protein